MGRLGATAGWFGITLLVGLAAILVLASSGQEGELGSKQAWAALQAAEFRDRGSSRAGPIVAKLGDYSILGVPGIGKPVGGETSPPASKRSWLILNEHAQDGSLRLINAYPRYAIDCGYVEALKTEVADADDYVLDYLRTICTPSAW